MPSLSMPFTMRLPDTQSDLNPSTTFQASKMMSLTDFSYTIEKRRPPKNPSRRTPSPLHGRHLMSAPEFVAFRSTIDNIADPRLEAAPGHGRSAVTGQTEAAKISAPTTPANSPGRSADGFSRSRVGPSDSTDPADRLLRLKRLNKSTASSPAALPRPSLVISFVRTLWQCLRTTPPLGLNPTITMACWSRLLRLDAASASAPVRSKKARQLEEGLKNVSGTAENVPDLRELGFHLGWLRSGCSSIAGVNRGN